MSNKIKIILIIAALTVSFAAGRYSVPTHTVTEAEKLEVEKIIETRNAEIEKERHKKTTITEITRPDGTKEKTTVIESDTKTEKKDNSSTTTDTTKLELDKKEVVKDSGRVTLSVLAGAPVHGPLAPIFGVSMTAPVLGPITVGVWGLTTSEVGVSLGLTL